MYTYSFHTDRSLYSSYMPMINGSALHDTTDQSSNSQRITRQTTQQIFDEVLSIFEEQDENPTFSNDRSSSSSSNQSKSLLNDGSSLENSSYDSRFSPSEMPPHVVKTNKKRKVEENQVDGAVDQLTGDEKRKERNRQTASHFRFRMRKHLDAVEELQAATLTLGKKLSGKMASVLSIPPLENEDCGNTKKIKFDVEECEKQYKLIKKTHQWIENAMLFAVDQAQKNGEQIQKMGHQARMQESRIAALQAENESLRVLQR